MIQENKSSNQIKNSLEWDDKSKEKGNSHILILRASSNTTGIRIQQAETFALVRRTNKTCIAYLG